MFVILRHFEESIDSNQLTCKTCIHVSSLSIPLILDYKISNDCYSLCFKIKVTFRHKLHYDNTLGENFLKLCQTSWRLARNNVNVVANEPSSQATIYTCLTSDSWTRRRRCTSTRFYALRCHLPKMAGF